MRILVITQKVNENDSVLGFFCGWLNGLAKGIDKVYVIALEVKNVNLANNIEFYSLYKENGSNRLRRFLKFNRVLLNLCLNKKIDIILIHMCPEYAILSWLYAKLKNIPIVMWYAHKDVGIYLRLGDILINKIITSSRCGLRIKTDKAIVTGQGIDVDKFKILPSVQDTVQYGVDSCLLGGQAKPRIQDNGKKMILSVGRISPIKNYEVLIKAVDILVNQKNVRGLKFQIVGDVPLKLQETYLDFLRDIIRRYNLEDYIQLIGPVPYTRIHNYYQNCDLFVSTSDTGSLDKAVLEAMACEKVVLTCNEAFFDLLKIYAHILLFDKNNADSLAEKIIYILEMDRRERHRLAGSLREIVIRNHNLKRFIDNILTVFKDTINHK